MSPRHLAAALGLAAATVLATAPAALAAPPPTGHNCAGTFVTEVASPKFGPAVAALAKEQGVDDLGLANCGLTPRNDP
ncbi:hypothetical protein SAMN06273567_11056 [Geodermatophilus aquaeductus]|uniref:Uncharacterized protein n=1 Tax=Geodermatophilus aquaeductus TaxID=1564161 RepID=A0A521FKT1_9ACTN|nr:hypothetical protein [Geodermatophilus aquaeductus]SMO96654.1 hypothetical protein SAMN06273567_11056 [Geodermatophilus aquaeductus]